MNGVIELCEGKTVEMGNLGEHVITVSELCSMSMNKKELSLLGINEMMLFNIFINLNSLGDQKLDVETIIKMDKPPKKRWRLRLDKKTFEFICQKTGKSNLFYLTKRKSVRFIDNDFLKENNFTGNDILDLSKNFIVYGKINLNSDNLIMLRFDKKIVKVADTKIDIGFNLSADSYFCNKSRRCPLLERCDSFFKLAASKHHTSFSCDKCIIYMCEKFLERDGAFRERDIYSYGISDYSGFL